MLFHLRDADVGVDHEQRECDACEMIECRRGCAGCALNGKRFNVSCEDINVLALPVLRHRIKPSFAAITEKIGTDELIRQLIDQLDGKSQPGKLQEVLKSKRKK